jgi:hypothetical protein
MCCIIKYLHLISSNNDDAEKNNIFSDFKLFFFFLNLLMQSNRRNTKTMILNFLQCLEKHIYVLKLFIIIIKIIMIDDDEVRKASS